MIQKEVQQEVERFLSNTKDVGTDYRHCPPRRFPSASNSLKLVLWIGNLGCLHGSDWQNNLLTSRTAIWISRRSHQVCRGVSPIYYVTPLNCTSLLSQEISRYLRGYLRMNFRYFQMIYRFVAFEKEMGGSTLLNLTLYSAALHFSACVNVTSSNVATEQRKTAFRLRYV